MTLRNFTKFFALLIGSMLAFSVIIRSFFFERSISIGIIEIIVLIGVLLIFLSFKVNRQISHKFNGIGSLLCSSPFVLELYKTIHDCKIELIACSSVLSSPMFYVFIFIVFVLLSNVYFSIGSVTEKELKS